MRVARWIPVVALVAVALSGPAQSNDKPKTGMQVTLAAQARDVAHMRSRVWGCQDRLWMQHTRPSVSPWALPRSVGYRQWVLARWTGRALACEHVVAGRDRVARQLDRSLARSPMKGTGRALERAGWEYGVHPAFIAAISWTESSLGAHACSSNRFNAFGLASCGTSWRVPGFTSWEDAYEFMGDFLTGRWPSATTPWHFYGYAKCSSCWGTKTAEHMRSLGFGPSIRYGPRWGANLDT